MRISLFSACLILLCNCARIEQGDGVPVHQSRDVAAFTAIQNEINVDVRVTIAAERSVAVDCDRNLAGLIHTEVSGDTLVVGLPFDTSIAPHGPCAVNVSMPDLTRVLDQGSGGIYAIGTTPIALASITGDGSGQIEIDAPIAIDELTATNSGSGDIVVSAYTGQHASLRVDGSGPITVQAGMADAVDAVVDGSGSLDAGGLQASRGTVLVGGSGDAELRCTERIDATVSGSGSATIFGSPGERHESVSGSGQILYQ